MLRWRLSSRARVDARLQVVDSNFQLSKGRVYAEWFQGGKTNVCYNALDRHAQGPAKDKVAFYW